MDGHSALQATSDITHAHTPEKSHIRAPMRAVEEILPHLAICAITSVHTAGRGPSSVSILAVIVCSLGQHTWSTTWRLTQGTEHITAHLKAATRAFMCYSDSMFTWEYTRVKDLIPVMWKIVWSHSLHKEIWKITWESILVSVGIKKNKKLYLPENQCVSNIDHLHTAKRGEAGGMKLYNLHFYNKALFGRTGWQDIH